MNFADAREAAAEYLRRGFSIVPIPRAEKGPRTTGWAGSKFSEEDIRTDANLGVKTGAASGNLIDVDLDCDEAILLGSLWLPATEMRHGRSKHPRSHYWYRVSLGAPRRKTYAVPPSIEGDRSKAMLVELRGEGCQTAVPPSTYADGDQLRWEQFGAPGEVTLGDLEAVVARIAAGALLSRLWRDGQRHDATLPLAGFLLRRWSRERVAQFFDGIAQVAGANRRKVASDVRDTARKLDLGEQVSGGPHLNDFFPEAALSAAFGWLGMAGESDTWPDPVPFGVPMGLPEFPLETLPTAIRDFVGAVAHSIQVPIDLPAMLALGSLAAVAARRFVVRVKEDYYEPSNLFVACAAEPGERKTATMRACLKPIEQAERRLVEDAQPRLAVAAEQRRVEEARIEFLRREAAKAGSILSAEARELAEKLTEIPPLPKLVVGDVTPEQLGTVLAQQGGRIALADAESGGVFEIMAGRYAGNRRPNVDVFLRGHAGDDHRVDRRDRSEIVRQPALTLILAPQPVVLDRLALEPQFRGRGLLARFLYALPISRVGSRNFVHSAVQLETATAYANVITRILEVAPPEGGGPGYDLKLSPGALVVWEDFYNQNESRQQEGQELRPIRDWASKAPGAALRIAGLLHLAEGRRQDAEIPTETMTAAWAIVRDYLTPHALEAFSIMSTGPNVTMARKIADWIFKTRRTRVTIRDAHKNFPRFGEPAAFRAPFEVLVGRAIVAEANEDSRPGPGRKASPAFLVNPKFTKRSAKLSQDSAPINFADSAEDPEEGDHDFFASAAP